MKGMQSSSASNSTESILSAFVFSLLIPPIGIVKGIRYLAIKDDKSRIIGCSAIVLSIVTLAVAAYTIIRFSNVFFQHEISREFGQMY